MRLMRMVLSFRRLSGISSNFTVTLSYKSLPQRFIPAKRRKVQGEGAENRQCATR